MKAYNHEWLIAEWERMGGPEVEYLYCDGTEVPVWMDDKDPVFYDDVQYRIKCKPWINWDHVSEKYSCLFSDDFKSYISTGSDITEDTHYDFGICCDADNFSSFTPGTCDWRDSLVMRPVFIGEE
jgi:hypothetical protein